MDAGDEKYKILDDLYTNIESPASFSSAKKLLKAARENSTLDITSNDVSNYLSLQPSFTKHGMIRKKYHRSMVIVPSPGILLSSDLADFTNLKSYNNGFCHLVFFIDCYSRKLSITPIKDKRGATLARALDQYLTASEYSYLQWWIDRGSEFYNSHVDKICEKHNIKRYSTQNYKIKASYSERAIKTIKGKIYRIFTHLNTYNYIDHLDKIVCAYNNSAHAGLLGSTPNVVHKIKDGRVLHELTKRMVKQKLSNYGSIKSVHRQMKASNKKILPLNTHVRLLAINADHIFNKSYLPIFTEEVFSIAHVNLNEYPITYRLNDLNNQPIQGRVYREELKVAAKPTLFDIEKVIQRKYCKKTRKKLALVKFVGYPESFNLWLNANDLIDK